MKKLNKRQIIILVVAALCVLYAAYELLIAGPAGKKNKREDKPVETTSFVNEISNDLMKNKLAGFDVYVTRRAEAGWSKSPFWDKTSYREFTGKDADSGVAGKIIYSGYVDTGRNKMAIINGAEYSAGENLELEGYKLKKVTPSSVLIINSNTGVEFSVSIQE